MLVLLDNGHGSLIDGRPQTGERRSKVFDDGSQLFEGELNRGIVNGIIQELAFMNIPYDVICPEHEDIKLGTRVERANKYKNETDCFLISVHANANEGRPGSGSEFWIFKHSSLGPQIGTIFAEEFKRMFPDERLRVGDAGEKFKRNNSWAMLKRTAMPAVLTENFFFNNQRETREILQTREGRNKIIDFHVSAIIRVFVEVFGVDMGFND